MKFSYLLFLIGIISPLYSCPFIITNDSKEPLIITDPHAKFAVYIEPTHTKTINPEVAGIWKYFYNEQLNIYVPRDQQGNFFQEYQIGKHICKEEGNKLTFSHIKELAKDPNNPFGIQHFVFKEKTENHPHDHDKPHSH